MRLIVCHVQLVAQEDQNLMPENKLEGSLLALSVESWEGSARRSRSRGRAWLEAARAAHARGRNSAAEDVRARRLKSLALQTSRRGRNTRCRSQIG